MRGLKNRKYRQRIADSNTPEHAEDTSTVAHTGPSPLPETDRSRSHFRRWRIALYSHDTMGLGHVRRNLLIARTLGSSHLQPVMLIVTGTREAAVFTIPQEADYLTLPALYKEVDGHYRSRSLAISLEEVIVLRARTIHAALEAFDPDVLIVDKVPRGAVGELDLTLRYLRQAQRCRCVLGLRDILDDPVTVHREWSLSGTQEAIRNYYDSVWVYGDPKVYNLVREYELPADIAAAVRYTGYLGQHSLPKFARPYEEETTAHLGLPSNKFALCLVGGGQDGEHLAKAFIEAKFPEGTGGVIVTGPFMPAGTLQYLRSRAASSPHLRVLGFIPQVVSLLEQADRVIAMGGYNTVCEILSFEKPALIVPRVSPRIEQLIRAERLHALGLVDMIHPDKLNPQALSEWLYRDLLPPVQAHKRIDLNGVQRLPKLLEELMATPSRPFQSEPRKRRVQLVGH